MYSYSATSSTMGTNENQKVSASTRQKVAQLAKNLEEWDCLVYSCEQLAQLRAPLSLFQEFKVDQLAQRIYKTAEKEELRDAARWLVDRLEEMAAPPVHRRATRKPDQLPLRGMQTEEWKEREEKKKTEREEQRLKTIERLLKGRETVESRKRKAEVAITAEEPKPKKSFLTEEPRAKKVLHTDKPKTEAEKKTFLNVKKSFVKKQKTPVIICID